jgi:hypothetical protein
MEFWRGNADLPVVVVVCGVVFVVTSSLYICIYISIYIHIIYIVYIYICILYGRTSGRTLINI